MAEFIVTDQRPALRISAYAAGGAANVSLVTITAARVDGKPGPYNMDVWLSDAASGAGLTAITATGAVAAGASGIILSTFVASKAFRVQTNAAGVFILSITDTAKSAFVVCAEVEGRAYPLITLSTANYT